MGLRQSLDRGKRNVEKPTQGRRIEDVPLEITRHAVLEVPRCRWVLGERAEDKLGLLVQVLPSVLLQLKEGVGGVDELSEDGLYRA